MATYGEGEPTQNAVDLYEFLASPTFASGAEGLDNLRYIVFALGNRTYEHYCAAGRQLDERLASLGARRIGPRGEGDHNLSINEDYLAWKDAILQDLATEMGFAESGRGTAAPDFQVSYLESDPPHVYLGELSSGNLGAYSDKNPYVAPVIQSSELYLSGDRNCVFAEFGIKETGIRYHAGDHLGVWATNAEVEVERTLQALGLADKRQAIIDVTSLDPDLVKVPFPTPTSIETVFRHYLDISSLVSRQMCSYLAAWAEPTAAARLQAWGQDPALFQSEVAARTLRFGKLLVHANGEDYLGDPTITSITPWKIPLDRVISLLPRLQARYYSISSSPKLHPDSIQLTVVAEKFRPTHEAHSPEEYVHGVASNYLLSVSSRRIASLAPLQGLLPDSTTPEYHLRPHGPNCEAFSIPIHVRASTFRLPPSPKTPVIMIGAGTGVAPFRGFVQERVATARIAIDQRGPDAIRDWGDMVLFFGCRSPEVDYLYEAEWREYAKELDGKLKVFTAFSRSPDTPKEYVQHKMNTERAMLLDLIETHRSYVYICGDGKRMARDVEDELRNVLGDSEQLQALKTSGRLQLDVW